MLILHQIIQVGIHYKFHRKPSAHDFEVHIASPGIFFDILIGKERRACHTLLKISSLLYLIRTSEITSGIVLQLQSGFIPIVFQALRTIGITDFIYQNLHLIRNGFQIL